MPLQITVLEKKPTTQNAFESLESFEVKPKLIAEVVRSELLNLRAGNANTKTRGEVRGGGRKPWKQKGTGRARQGSIRSPQWVGGGIVFGPRAARNWSVKINRKAKVTALKSILKDKLSNQSVYQLPSNFSLAKTKEAIELITPISQSKSVGKDFTLVYTTSEKVNLSGFSNLEVNKINAENLKLHKLIARKNIILTPAAKEVLENKVSK